VTIYLCWHGAGIAQLVQRRATVRTAGIRFLARSREFSLPHSVRRDDPSRPSNAEVKNGEAIPPLCHMSSWHSAYLSTATTFYFVHINSFHFYIFHRVKAYSIECNKRYFPWVTLWSVPEWKVVLPSEITEAERRFHINRFVDLRSTVLNLVYRYRGCGLYTASGEVERWYITQGYISCFENSVYDEDERKEGRK
jgi:hypothetical protein